MGDNNNNNNKLKDTLNQQWANDTSRFGYQMLLKMGWKGSGLGTNQQGRETYVKVTRVKDAKGIGCDVDNVGNRALSSQIDGLNEVLKSLQNEHVGKKKRTRSDSLVSASSNRSMTTRSMTSASGDERNEKTKRAKKDDKKSIKSKSSKKNQSDSSDSDSSDSDNDSNSSNSDSEDDKKKQKQKQNQKSSNKNSKSKEKDKSTKVTSKPESKFIRKLSNAKDASKYSQTDLKAIFAASLPSSS